MRAFSSRPASGTTRACFWSISSRADRRAASCCVWLVIRWPVVVGMGAAGSAAGSSSAARSFRPAAAKAPGQVGAGSQVEAVGVFGQPGQLAGGRLAEDGQHVAHQGRGC